MGHDSPLVVTITGITHEKGQTWLVTQAAGCALRVTKGIGKKAALRSGVTKIGDRFVIDRADLVVRQADAPYSSTHMIGYGEVDSGQGVVELHPAKKARNLS